MSKIKTSVVGALGVLALERIERGDKRGALSLIEKYGPSYVASSFASLLALDEPGLAKIAKEGVLSQKIFERVKTAKGHGRPSGLLAWALCGDAHADDGWKQLGARLDALRVLESTGWSPSIKSLKEIVDFAWSEGSAEALVWIGERGHGPECESQFKDKVAWAIARALARAPLIHGSPSIHGVEGTQGWLRKLVACGMVRDEEGLYGWSDALISGADSVRSELEALGWTPRLTAIPDVIIPAGAHPGAAWARRAIACAREVGQAHRVGLNVAIEASHKAALVSALDYMDKMKTPWSVEDTQNERPQLNAFSGLVWERWFLRDRGEDMAFWAAEQLLARGAVINQSGGPLAQEVGDVGQSRSTEWLEWMLAHGAKPADNPLGVGKVLSGFACWGEAGMIKEAREWFDKLVSMGADPKKAAASKSVRKGYYGDYRDYGDHGDPVAACVRMRNYDMAAHAWKAGCRLDGEDDENGSNILHEMARQSAPAALRALSEFLKQPECAALVDKGLSGSCEQGDQGASPLSIAARALNIKAMRILLDHGADPHGADARGNTALHWAGAKYGRASDQKARAAVDMLMGAGADAGAKNLKGATACQAMASRGALGAVVRLVDERPEDLGAETAWAKKAGASLGKRGPMGKSLVEKAQLLALVNESLGAQEAPEPNAEPKPKRKSRSL